MTKKNIANLTAKPSVSGGKNRHVRYEDFIAANSQPINLKDEK